MSLDPTENSIDIRHLQTVLSRDRDEVDRRTEAPGSTPANNSKSVPLVPATPSRPPKESSHTTASHAPTDATSHDRTGSLHLHYTYSQIDIGETQVDPDSLQEHVPGTAPLAAPQTHEDCGTALEANTIVNIGTAERVASCDSVHRTPGKGATQVAEDDDDLLKSPEDETQIVLFPEANRFGTPRNTRSSPSQPGVRNPFAHLNLGGGSATKTFSLTQAFNAPSSPFERPRTSGGSSEPPPTPSVHAARIMAKSIPAAATIFEEQSSPAVRDTPVATQRRFSTVSKKSDSPDSSSRARSLSPTLFSSPPPLRNKVSDVMSESEDEFEKTQKKRRRAAARMKEGEQQLTKAIKNSSSRGVKKKSGRKLDRFPTIEEMNQWHGEREGSAEEEPEKTLVVNSRASSAPEPTLKSKAIQPDITSTKETITDCSPTQEINTTQISASDPPRPPTREATVQSQPAPVTIEAAWDQLQDILKPRRMRRTKSATLLNRKPSQDAKLQHRTTLPIAKSDLADAAIEKTSSEPVITSLKNMVPFNIPPTPPSRESEYPLPMSAPGLVRESSGLLPPTQLIPPSTVTPEPSSSPANDRQHRISDSTLPVAIDPITPYPQRISPLMRLRNGATTIPESSPYQRHDMLSPAPITEASKSTPGVRPPSSGSGPTASRGSPTRKRKRAAASGGENACERDRASRAETASNHNNDRLRNFNSLENSTPLFSSREEPDSVDMLGIVRGVGAGYQPELEFELPVNDPPRSKRPRPSPPKQPSLAPSSPALPSSAPATTRARQTKRKSTDAKGKAKEREKATTPVPLSTKLLVRKASKQKIRKGRVRTSLLQEATPTVTDNSSPFPGGRDINDEDDDSSDILSTTNPSFHITGLSKGNLPVPDRVFALFKDNKMQYHPATVMYNGRTEVRVMFDDGTQCTLERHQVRSLDLRVGDVIRVDIDGMRKSAWVTKSFPERPQPDPSTEGSELTDSHGHLTVLVAPKSATWTQSVEPVEVPITRIYLVKSLWQPFASRDIISTTTSIQVPLVHRTASPSLLTTPLNNPIRRTSTPFLHPFPPPTSGGVFNNMYFALSIDSDALRTTITNKLTSHGGRLLSNGFNELFVPETTPLSPSPTYASAGFTALIADRHTRKPKFLQALALGIPCLATRWVEDCSRLRKVQDWTLYLLPAGESSYLHGAVRSRVLEPYDAATASLSSVLEKRNKLMDGWNVDFRAKADKEKRGAFLFLLGAMGAGKVGVGGKGEGQQHWDVIVVGRGDKGLGRRGVRVMEDEEVLQSLILGRVVD